MEYRKGGLVDINGGIVVLGGLKNDAVLFVSYSENKKQRDKEIEEVSKFKKEFFSFDIGGSGYQKIGKTSISYSYTAYMKDLGRSCIVYNSSTNDFFAIIHESLSIVAIDNFITKVNHKYGEKLEKLGGFLRWPYILKQTPVGAMYDYSYLTAVRLFVGFHLCELVIK